MSSKESQLELSQPQQRIWYVEKLYPNTPIHNLGGIVKINGEVDLLLLEKAINMFVKNNEGIRMTFSENSGIPYQKIKAFRPENLEFQDFSESHDPDIACNRWVTEKISKPMNLVSNTLFEFALCKIRENQYGYLVKLHHIIADGWTIKLLTDQISRFYEDLFSDKVVEEDPKNSYIDYIKKEKNYFSSKRFLKDKKFWNSKLQSLQQTPLRNSNVNTCGKRISYKLSSTISNELHDFSKRHQISLNTLFSALTCIYVQRMTGQNDIIVGSPVLNRSGVKEKNTVGMFTSTMPLRVELHEEATIKEVLSTVNKEMLSSLFHQRYPYNHIIRDLNTRNNQLFNICINYYNTNLTNNLMGMSMRNEEKYNGHQLFPLQLVVKEWHENITLHYDYRLDCYSKLEIEHMNNFISNLIGLLLEDEHTKLKNISLLTNKEEETLVYKWNDTKTISKDCTIHELFEEQVKKSPENIALYYKNQKMTYKELNIYTNKFANFLRKKGVSRGTPVGIMARNSMEVIISILAVLKAGGAYLPIDSKLPENRISYILKDANVKFLLAEHKLPENIEYKGEIFFFDKVQYHLECPENLPTINKVTDLAYIIYTSGSTGKPKGTMIHHKGLVNYITWAQKQYIHNQNEVFAFYSSISFDLTITSIFTPIIGGNSIEIFRDNSKHYILQDVINSKKVDIVKLTPAHMSLLSDLDLSETQVKRLIVGGEKLNTELAKQVHYLFNERVDIFNEYGPTETVVGCMIHKFNPQTDTEGSVPIGKPISNTQIYLLDNNLSPVPVGVPGEIFISGDGISHGYLNQQQLTMKKFINNPFIKGTKMYKTGDIGVRVKNNDLRYLERKDRQVKIQGYRIELEEIENVLRAHKNILDAVVLDCDGIGNTRYLRAFIKDISPSSLNDYKRYLLDYLPSYMVPTQITLVDEIPLTLNGKVDRDSLLEKIQDSRTTKETVTEIDENAIEIITKIYKEILDINDIRTEENFYHLGGDSIKAIQASSRLRESGFNVRSEDILKFATISSLAANISKLDKDSVSQDNENGEIPKTPIVSWFSEQNFKNINHWNQSVLLNLKKKLNKEDLLRIMTKLIQHHDGLRINYNKQTQKLFYNEKHQNPEDIVYYCNLEERGMECGEARKLDFLNMVRSSIDVEESVLFKSCLIDYPKQGRQQLFLTAHHLVVDGFSWRIILEDIVTLINQMSQTVEDGLFNLPTKTISYKKWSEKLIEKSVDYSNEINFWNNTTEKDSYFPRALSKEKVNINQSIVTKGTLNQLETKMLLTSSNIIYNTTPVELMVAALANALSNFIGKDDVVIELEGHGRDDSESTIDVSRTVGWFTTLYPVRLKVNQKNISEQVISVKEQLRRIPNKGTGYGVLKYINKELSKNNRNPIRFNYLGELSSNLQNDYFCYSEENFGEDIAPENHMTAILDINAWIVNGTLHCSIRHCNQSEKEVENFLNLFMEYIRKILEHCDNETEKVFSPSDFETTDITEEELNRLFI
jgi:amino acid adenylation domain-containing protein/non-ribosomal peptide synthase protein (TIGR01720 family)